MANIADTGIMAISLTKKSLDDVDALVDLFLSSDFVPLTEEYRLNENHVEFEAEVDVEPLSYEETYGPQKQIHNEFFTKRCGQKLAQLGDELYRTYELPKTKSDKPWLGVADQVRSVVSGVVKLTEQGADASTLKQEEEKAWDHFKGIMSNSVAGTLVDDSYKKLGALLLTLRGLSDLSKAARGYVHCLYTRYIRETELNEVFQHKNGGGLDHLMELD